MHWKDYIVLELLCAYLRKHGILKVLNCKRSKRFYYAAIYNVFPRRVRKFLLKYYTVVRHYGVSGLMDLLRRKFFHKRPRVYSDINRSLRLINKEFLNGKPGI